jgi:cytochrome c biogenesis protein CcmG/thiol:disulfide interchange protein DsbE
MKNKMLAWVFIAVMLMATYYLLTNRSGTENISADSQEGSTYSLSNGSDATDTDSTDSASTEESVKVATETGVQAKKAATDFQLLGLDNQSYSLSEWTGKKPVVINYWASWCGPCKEETPDLIELSKKYGDQVVFYGLNMTMYDDLNDVKDFVKEFDIPYPVLLDIDGTVSANYNIQVVPTTVFIDKNGKVADRVLGLISMEEIERRIQKLLAD